MLKSVSDPCTIIRVQTWDSEALVPEALEDAVGAVWPREAGAVASGCADVICVGPTDWLVVAPDPDATTWLHRLGPLFDGSAFRATNVSQALIRIRIDSPTVRDLLAKGCSLDLHPHLFPPASAARTRLAGMPAILHCIDDSEFELIVTKSYAEFLVSWLADAELEFEIPA